MKPEMVHYVVVALDVGGRWMIGWIQRVLVMPNVSVVPIRSGSPCEGMAVGDFQ